MITFVFLLTPCVPRLVFLFSFPSNVEYNFTGLEHINQKKKKPPEFVSYRKSGWKKPQGQKAKTLGASRGKGGLVIVGRGNRMEKGQKGHAVLWPGCKLPLTSFQKTAKGVKKSLRQGTHRALLPYLY